MDYYKLLTLSTFFEDKLLIEIILGWWVSSGIRLAHSSPMEKAFIAVYMSIWIICKLNALFLFYMLLFLVSLKSYFYLVEFNWIKFLWLHNRSLRTFQKVSIFSHTYISYLISLHFPLWWLSFMVFFNNWMEILF